MKFMLDPEELDKKPLGSKQGVITNRIANHPVDLSPEQLVKEIGKGRTIVPAFLSHSDTTKIKRNKECWTSQELLLIDFDNERKIEGTKVKIRDVTMTIENALEEFRNEALFIYTSFGHTDHHPKIRVVLRFDQIVENPLEMDRILEYYKKKYPNADSKCFERSRMFYGGKELYIINYDNKVCIQDILDKNDTSVSSTRKNDRGVFNTYKILGINIKDIVGSKNPKCTETLIFHSKNDIYDYLLKRDLLEYLKIENKNFCCIFHQENKPSASIFTDPHTGNQLYKCHSACGFTGNIFKITERLFGLNRPQAFKKLCKHYNIVLEETEWQKEQKEILEHNIDYLLSGEMEVEYPELHVRIRRHIPLLVLLHQIAMRCIGSDLLKSTQESIFFSSLRYISQTCNSFVSEMQDLYTSNNTKINTDIKELNKRINLFAFLGIVNKLNVVDVPKEMIDLVEEKKMNKHNQHPNYYSIPSYSYHTLSNANDMAIEFKEKNLSMNGFSKEMLERSCGVDIANKVYPNEAKRKAGDTDKFADIVKEKLLLVIERKGWATEDDVIAEISDYSKTIVKRKIKKCLQEVLDGYGLNRARLNRELKESLGIEVTGYPYVIFKTP